MGTIPGPQPMTLREIVPEGGLSKLLQFSSPIVVFGPPYQVSVGVRSTNKRLPIQIQYLFDFFDSYGRKTNQTSDWSFKTLPPAVEVQIDGVSISENAKSWRLRVRPAK